MELELVLLKDYVQVFFKNTSSTEVRVWEMWNSWGWWTLSFQVKSDQGTDISTIVHSWEREWTVNARTMIAIAPGKIRRFSIDLNDGWWMRDHRIAGLKDQALLVRACYNVDPPSPDDFKLRTDFSKLSDRAKAYVMQDHEEFTAMLAQLFTGFVASDWVTSQPPHDWLFAETPRWTQTTEWLFRKSREEVLKVILSQVDVMTWRIANNARHITKESITSQMALENEPKTLVGHHLNAISEYAAEIRKAIKEGPAYLEGKVPPQQIDVIPEELRVYKDSEHRVPQAGDVKIDGFGIPMVYVPAGKFLMGSDPELDENARENEQPQQEIVFAQGFWIDQYIVTNEAYAVFVNAGGYQNRQFWSEAGWHWRQARQMDGPPDIEDFNGPKQPRVGITWFEAAAYSTWRGGRLPTEAEWEYAARGPQNLIYPWGNDWNPDFPRHEWNSPFGVWSGNQGKRNTILSGGPAVLGKSLDVGSKPRGRSWVNAYDMAGNADEWCSSVYKPYPYKAVEGQEAFDYTTRMVLRGGSWESHFTNLRCACRWSFSPNVGQLGFSVRPIFPLDRQL